MMGKCALCLNHKNLRESHIIPKFVTRWLKKTSPTGFLRQAINPNERKQDSYKKHLFCHDCEQLFSKLEKYFADNIFYPYLTSRPKTFSYDERLMRFIVALNWRTLLDSSMYELPWDARFLAKKFLKKGRLFLLGKLSVFPYEQHLSFMSEIESFPEGFATPPRFHQYLLRSIDTTPVTQIKKRFYKKRKLFQYTKLPHMALVSFLKPKSNSLWIGTRVDQSGVINIKQEIKDGLYGQFLLDRATEVNKMYHSKISQKQQDIVQKDALKNFEKFKNSGTFAAYQADKKINSNYK